MSSKSTFSNSTSESYALALYELSKENSELEQVEDNIKSLNQLVNESFPNQRLVFGVKIIGTEHTPSKSIKKASSILKQWLDNDNDGNPDNQLVIESIIQNNGMLIMGKSESDFEDAFDTLIEIFEDIY